MNWPFINSKLFKTNHFKLRRQKENLKRFFLCYGNCQFIVQKLRVVRVYCGKCDLFKTTTNKEIESNWPCALKLLRSNENIRFFSTQAYGEMKTNCSVCRAPNELEFIFFYWFENILLPAHNVVNILILLC